MAALLGTRPKAQTCGIWQSGIKRHGQLVLSTNATGKQWQELDILQQSSLLSER